VLGVPRPRGQHDRAVVAGEGRHLGCQFGVEPVRPGHGGAQVVRHQRLRHAAEVPEGVLQAAHELLRALPEHGLAVALAGVREHDPQDPRPAALPVCQHRGSEPEVDLRLLAGRALHALDALRVAAREPPHVALHGVVRALEAPLRAQILEDALRRQPSLDAGEDRLVVRPAQARAPANPGGRNGRFWSCRLSGPGGRNGWF